MGYVNNYFKWLQKDCPTGEVERYPELDKDGQTTLPGVYVVGDLTGIPLLKMAALGGSSIIRQFSYDKEFLNAPVGDCDYSVVIIGGGPAGVAAAMECSKRKISYILLEGSKLFNTIENFPKGKPILLKPDDLVVESDLKMNDGVKETLLEDLKSSTAEHPLNIKNGFRVEQISRKKNSMVYVGGRGETYSCRRVVLAIGKSGDARRLQVVGEDLQKVSNHLYDAGEFQNKNILVVGGGDTAVENACALAATGNKVTLSYRKGVIARAKEENVERLSHWQKEGRVKLILNSDVTEINEHWAHLNINGKEEKLANDAVFVNVGRELPVKFLRRSGIRMEGDNTMAYWTYLTAMLSFFTMLYCGKSGWAIDVLGNAEGISGKIVAFLKAPFHDSVKGFGANWYASFNFMLAWLASFVFAISGIG
ncbi:MAG: NAD(P)-binding domain-containing protein, partial [Lentisphaeraceae bacterium]|nr:NAD(P)-binding domain-containing protein [Lentisphaeraceae bacterium]